jgi:hypothetical protein
MAGDTVKMEGKCLEIQMKFRYSAGGDGALPRSVTEINKSTKSTVFMVLNA